MVSMKEKNWTSGRVVDAMRSTMAIPLYFRPVRIRDEVLTDGGTRNNFPADIAKAMGADIIIGSEMPVPRDLTDMNTLANLAMQNITMMSFESAEANRKLTDLLLQHTLEGYNMLSFDSDSVEDIIRQGYEEALKNKEGFEAIARRVGAPVKQTLARPTPVDLSKREVLVREVRVEGVSDREQKFLLSKHYIQRDGLYSRADIERIIASIYGTRAFESVTYRLEGAQEPYSLIFDVQPGQVNEFGVGVHVDQDEVAYASVRLGLGTRRLSGLRFVTEAKIGNAATLDLNLSYKPMHHLPSFGIRTKTSYLNVMYMDGSRDVKIKAVNTLFDAYLEDSYLVNGTFRFGLSWELEPFENYLDKHFAWKGLDLKSNWWSTFVDFKYDTLDDGYFPSKGFQFGVRSRYVFGGYSIFQEAENVPDSYEGPVEPYLTGTAHLTAAIPLGKRLTVQPAAWVAWSTAYSGQMNFVHSLIAGGTLPGRYMENQIPYIGYSTGFTLLESLATMGQLDLRYQLNHANYLTLTGALLLSSSNPGELFTNPLSSYAIGLTFGRKTVAGPLQLGFHWCDTTGFGLLLGFGFDF